MLLGFLLTGCAPATQGPPDPWVTPIANPLDSDAPYGLVAVDDGGTRLLQVDNVDGEPALVPLDVQLAGASDSLRFVSFESDVLGEDVGLYVLSSGATEAFFVDVAVFADRDHRIDQRALPLGSRPWDVATGELEWLALSLRGTSTVEILPLDEEPFQVHLAGHADDDGSPEVGTLAWLGEDLVVALERRDGDDGPPSPDGGLLVVIDEHGSIETIPTGDLPELRAPSGPGARVLLLSRSADGLTAFDLDPDAARGEGPLRLHASDLDGELLDVLLAPDGDLLALVRTGDSTRVDCVPAGTGSPEPLLETDGVAVHGHLSVTGVLSLAVADGDAGRVEVFGFGGCQSAPVPLWSLALDQRPLAVAMGGPLVLGLL